MRTAARALVRRAPWAAPRKRALHRSRAWLDVRPFLLADIGEGIAEVELMQWFVKEGDHVGEFDPICEVQSDKATVEITSRYAGVVSKVHHALGDIVPVGNALIDIDMDGGGAAADAAVTVPDAAPEAAAPVAAGAPAVEELRPAAPPAQADSGKVLTTPAVRRIAKERGLDLALIRGSGPNGRILKGDVLGGDPYTAAAKTMPRMPKR
uniref:Lipoamide acyltransferase component of branched-chain alpha-keto acid dehydrogenase complex, mitochondrial n=1 Tax=Phaeomonas parva TaxID=124430 RepID=A0A7S1XNN7_9STRA|mmetsp:Transcript_20683/g.62934  ORF Transcript_20683/g.62934 Transcript_20683/m.62934 type:complete len:209 (+) Transcript_20683:105-731(+)